MTAAEASRRVVPALQTAPVVDAARAALRPPGPVRWIAETLADRIEFRTVVRRWSTAAEPQARLARLSCGTALRSARLAVAVQGRRPLVSSPERPGLLAVVHAGDDVAPSRTDLLLHAVLLGADRPVCPPGRTAALLHLRQAAESEGAWLRVLPPVPLTALGPSWTGDDGPVSADAILALVGAAGRLPVGDLRVGQALETIRLTAAALGLGVRVVAAPATDTAPGVRQVAGPDAGSLAVVRFSQPDAHPCNGPGRGC